MSDTISLTTNVLGRGIASIYHNSNNKNVIGFVKREISTRILASSTFIFELLDALANCGAGLTTLSLCALKKAGIKKLCGKKYTLKIAKNYFDAVKKSSIGVVINTPRYVYNPKLLFDQFSKDQTRKLNSLKNISIKELPQDKKIDPFIIDHQSLAIKELKEMGLEEQNRDYHLLKYVGHARIINLDRDHLRLTGANEHFAKIGVAPGGVERFPAVLGRELPREIWDRFPNPPNYPLDTPEKIAGIDKWHQSQAGCYMSHYRIIQESKMNHTKAKDDYERIQQELTALKKQNPTYHLPLGSAHVKAKIHQLDQELAEALERIKRFSSVLVMEDDNRFGRVLDKVKKETTLENVGVVFRQVMKELPDDFDMLFLASITSEKETWGKMKDIPGAKNTRNRLKKIENERIVKLDYGHATNAYIVHARFYDTLIEKLKIIDIPGQPLKAVDVLIAELMENSKTYLAVPPIAYQGGDLSNVSSRDLPLIQPNKKLWKMIKVFN